MANAAALLHRAVHSVLASLMIKSLNAMNNAVANLEPKCSFFFLGVNLVHFVLIACTIAQHQAAECAHQVDNEVQSVEHLNTYTCSLRLTLILAVKIMFGS
jgi:hypothetical protein